jgi:rhamnogalacturonan endolyase
VGGHFGSGELRFAAGEEWRKVYGPVFVYLNEGESTDAMWQDAKERAAREVERWPYPWMDTPGYARERGSVAGRVKLTDGTSAKGAWAMLAPAEEDWSQVTKGYEFWTRVDAEGGFRIDKAIPGRYALVITGANQFEDFRREGVEVTAEGVTQLPALEWRPVKHGRTLWQIGAADRSTAEFKGGDDARHYENYARYPREFPEDVTFVVGKSREREDWNFAQWAIYNKRPYWTIQFEQAEPLTGKATLTLGFVSSIPPRGSRTNLQVKVNGREVQVIHLAKSGMAGYRSGSQDSVYSVVYVTFDAALLKQGTNQITLGHAEAERYSADRRGVPGEVMYDAIRLEVQ